MNQLAAVFFQKEVLFRNLGMFQESMTTFQMFTALENTTNY
jgi:hypothetical protein